MAMRRETGVQGDLVATWAEMPRSPGHAFYDKLQKLLTEAGFDGFVEEICAPYYAPRMGAPSLPPGRVGNVFRTHPQSKKGNVRPIADSGPSRTVIPAHRGQHSGDRGQFLMSV